MVSYSGIAKLPVRAGGDVPDLSASTSEQSIVLDPITVPYFATETARDTAYAAAIAGTGAYTSAGPQKGMRCYVQAGPAGYPDWCGWNGIEWLYDHPAPLTYNSGSISGTSVNYTTLTGHNPSTFAINPTRSGFAEVRVVVSASSGVAGYGSGYLRARYSSGTLLPGGTGFTVIEEAAAGARRDTIQHYPVPIWLTKGVTTTLAFDLASFSISGGAYWALGTTQWLVTQT